MSFAIIAYVACCDAFCALGERSIRNASCTLRLLFLIALFSLQDRHAENSVILYY